MAEQTSPARAGASGPPVGTGTPGAASTPGRPGGSPSGPSLMPLLRPYRSTIATIIALTVLANALNLVVPRLIARAIDGYGANQLVVGTLVVEFLAVALGIFVLTYLQNIAQTLASERVARDLRTQIVAVVVRWM